MPEPEPEPEPEPMPGKKGKRRPVEPEPEPPEYLGSAADLVKLLLQPGEPASPDWM